MYTIYLLTNLKKNKNYVGKTTRPVLERFEEHASKKNTELYRDIKKDRTNFRIKILHITTDLNELHNKEIEYIEFYNCLKPMGYNHHKNKKVVQTNNLSYFSILNDFFLFKLFCSLFKKNIKIPEIKSQNIITFKTHNYIGVYQRKNKYGLSNRFRVSQRHKNNTICGGSYDSAKKAAIIRDLIVVNYDVKNTKLNFPKYLSIYKGLKIDFGNDLIVELEKLYQIFDNYQKELKIDNR